jgi:hypothetical protein
MPLQVQRVGAVPKSHLDVVHATLHVEEKDAGKPQVLRSLVHLRIEDVLRRTS